MVVIPDIADRSNLVDRNPEQQILGEKKNKGPLISWQNYW